MGQTWLIGGSVAVLLLINSIGTTVIPLRELHFTADRYSKSFGVRADNADYHLPVTVTPNRYKITLTPNFVDFDFDGEMDIEVTAETATSSISLHYDNITIHNITVTDDAAEDGVFLPVQREEYNEETNIYTITLNDALEPGNYSIHINYTGHLLDDMAGFYRSSYTDADGEVRWLATTQFEPTDARRAFPCFDEPGLKAHFQIIIRRPQNLASISNMPLLNSTAISGDLVEDIFEETPRMSTYLVAFIVSDFKNLSTLDNNLSYHIWVREDALTQADYSVSISPGIIQFMENFTEIDFEMNKLDQAAIPDFSAGAMENWGLVTYRERLLLYKEDTSTTSSKQNIATVIAHELGHQWFGDLVSPAWWDYLWLNEGFATYFEYFATLAVEPSWRLEHQFVVNVHQNALVADSSAGTHPITASVHSPAQISSIFDTISYDKAGSIIRTAEHFLTRDTFVRGLRNYLKSKEYQPATADDLFSELHQQAVEDDIFSGINLNVTLILESWTTQSGYPYITVQRTENGFHIIQKRFLITGEPEEEPTTWWVPITYTKKNSIDFSTTTPTVWLEDVAEADIETELAEDEWIILNIQETAFYRVLYDEVNYQLLIDYLKSEEYSNIHPLNRAQLLDDSLNLARAGLLNYSTALDLTTYLAKETDFIPWISYFRVLTFLNTRFSGTQDYEIFKSYVLQLIENLYKTVGFDVLQNDEHLTKLIRVTTLTWACNFNHELCLSEASALFRSWMDNDSVNTIPPDLRSVAYCSALSNGGEEEWNFLWKQYLNSNVATDQVLILAALGCTRNITLLNTYLQSSITDNSGIRIQDSQSVFSAVYSRVEGVDVAFDFLTTNFVQIQQYYTSMNALGNIISGIASRLTTHEQHQKLQEFIEHQAELGPAQSAATAALATVEANLAWFDQYHGDILAWLVESTSTTATSAAASTTTATTEPTTATTDAACSLSFSPIMCIIILTGYMVVKY